MVILQQERDVRALACVKPVDHMPPHPVTASVAPEAPDHC